MTAIWLLSSRGRPVEAQACIDACQAAGMTSRGVLYVDETVREYTGVVLPPNWTTHYEPRWLSLQGSMSWCFEKYPVASRYGWLADDTRPQTFGWDKQLEAAAGGWNLAYARDLWLSEDPFEAANLAAGRNLSSGLCWGGNLVRTVGWWALPGVRQAGIDTAWTELVRPLGLHRYTEDVVVEHLHYKAGKRPVDAGDSWTRDGFGYVEADIAARDRWARSIDYRNLLRKLAARAPDVDREQTDAAIRASIIDEMWSNGPLPGARLQRIMEGTLDVTDYDRANHPAAFFDSDADA